MYRKTQMILDEALLTETSLPECDINNVILLVENGANVNTSNENGVTPLMFRAMYNDYETSKYLRENGANIKKKNKLGHVARDYSSDPELCEILSMGGKSNSKDAGRDGK